MTWTEPHLLDVQRLSADQIETIMSLATQLREGLDRDTDAEQILGREHVALLFAEPSTVRPAQLGTHHDHRLAMAFAVLGTANEGIEVADADVVAKSWPGFWSMLDELTS